MHIKVFVKLKKTLKTLSSGQKNPKNPLGWFFYIKKPGFFPTLNANANVALSPGWGGVQSQHPPNLRGCG
jgi:hypothetical protein